MWLCWKKNEVKTSEISINENEHKEEKIEINGNENTYTPKSENNNLITCPDCKKEISRNAELCPHCGAPNIEITNTKSNNILIIGGVISVLLFIIIIILYNGYCSKYWLSNMCSLHRYMTIY